MDDTNYIASPFRRDPPAIGCTSTDVAGHLINFTTAHEHHIHPHSFEKTTHPMPLACHPSAVCATQSPARMRNRGCAHLYSPQPPFRPPARPLPSRRALADRPRASCARDINLTPKHANPMTTPNLYSSEYSQRPRTELRMSRTARRRTQCRHHRR